MEKEETVASSHTEVSEPEPKKLKMSTTTTSDDEDTTVTVAGDGDGNTQVKKPRYKRRKIAIFFAYCGVGYQGMQKNPGAKTIEGDLEQALYQAGGVPEHDKYQPRKYDWARSARTDKGVSAVGQVVSGRFYVDPPGFIDRLNSILCPQIRIFGFKRVTGAFNSKKFCDKRRYVYLIPVFALDPSAHRDRESVLASLGSGQELVKCLECSERGRKVFGVMGKRSFDWKTESGISSNDGSAPEPILHNTESEVNANDLITDSNMVIENGTDVNENVEEMGADVNENAEKMNEGVVTGDENANAVKEQVEESVFCYGEKEKERFNRILKYYEGTHNFHNFTTRTKAEDPAAKRYIISFNANTVVNVEGIDFVKCEVVGQSFMLHQIRKMIGLAVAIMRNYSPESLIETAFRRDVNINVPMAPEVGLYLDECFFTSYNKKWKDTHEELSMKDYAEEAEEFKMKNIYSHIASTEHKDGTMALFLHSLNYRNYPDLRVVDNGNSAGAGTGTVDGSKVVEAAVEAGSEVTEAVVKASSEVTEAVVKAEVTEAVVKAEVSEAVVKAEVSEAVVKAEVSEAVVKAEVTEAVVKAEVSEAVVKAEVTEAVVKASSEVTEAVGEPDSEVTEAVVEAGLGAVNHGESTDARNVEAGHDDLVNS